MADVALDHPANAGLRRYLEPRHQRPGVAPIASPDSVEDPYYSLGTHPDLVARLWEELNQALPEDCRVVFYSAPALIHPKSRVVFGFAGGTHTYALRLPEPERSQAIRAGATRVMRYSTGPSLDLEDIGEEWIFCKWFPAEEAWCRAAYAFAGSAP